MESLDTVTPEIIEDREEAINGERQKERKDKDQSGFTLIEIMVVVMIIGLLAGLVGARIWQYIGPAKQNAAKAQIMNFKTSLDKYYMDNGRYPTTEQGLQALVEKPAGFPEPKNYDPDGYLDSIPLDPWGYEYVYFSPGVQGGKYSLESYGADGVDGGEGEDADIESWNMSN